jgi:murein DD-endopeptidase MepM/ murein hydrolase activator NlpD
MADSLQPWRRRLDRAIIAAAVVCAAALVSAAPQIAVTASSSTARPGDVIVLTIDSTEPLRVRAFNRDVPTFAAGKTRVRALVGVDLQIAPGPHRITIDAGKTQTTFPLRITPRKFPTRTLSVDPAFVNPPPDAVPRIERERQQLEHLWETWTPAKLWDGPFVPPVPQPANSAFGTRTILNGEPRSPHSGADFASPAGTPIKAPNSGRVVLADALYYTGNTVVIDHGLGLYSLFAHLTELAVHTDDMVKTGDVVGTVGSTGRVTGPHLHWSVRLTGARVDPTVLLRVVR